MKIYKPRQLFLVSKKPVPGKVKNELEEEGITVIDTVEFNTERLRPIAETLEALASYKGLEGLPVIVPADVLFSIERIAVELGLEPQKVLEAVIREAARNPEIVKQALRVQGMV